MALIGVNSVSEGRPKQSTFDQVISGLDVAAKILGLGLSGAEIYQRSRSNDINQQHVNIGQQALNLNEATNLTPAKQGEPGAILYPGSQVFKSDEYVKPIQKASLVDEIGRENRNQAALFMKAKTDLEQMRGDPAVQIAKRNLLLANNALGVYKNYRGKLSEAPASLNNLFKMEEAKMASGGVPTEGELHAISDPTMLSGVQNLLSKLQNVPKGEAKGEFLPMHIDYVKELRQNAVDFLRSNFERKLKPWERFLQKQDVDALRGANLDFLHEVESATTNLNQAIPNIANQNLSTPAAPTYDSDVLEYAKKHNISNEQAQQIKLQRTAP